MDSADRRAAVTRLRKQIEQLSKELGKAEDQLEQLVMGCPHPSTKQGTESVWGGLKRASVTYCAVCDKVINETEIPRE